MSLTASQHQGDVRSRKRFEFGKNWKRFLSSLNENRIVLAEQSLQRTLKCERLDGKRFLDVGSGSGLFSLAARRLGATVRSFDYDSVSVACTQELKNRFFPQDQAWVVEQGSVLDERYLQSLGTYDVVYSWGVLHHTGAMQAAFANIKPLVKMGGLLYIAIYNDLGEITDHWDRIKQNYNRLPPLIRRIYALEIIAANERPAFLDHWKRGKLREYFALWRAYDQISTRGMSRWHDWIDWIGGYPYERATMEAVVDEFSKDGFVLTNLVDRSLGYGCNEFVFMRQAALGISVDSKLPQSRFVERQRGNKLTGPFSKEPQGYVTRLPSMLQNVPMKEFILFRNGELAGAIDVLSDGRAIVAPSDWLLSRVEGVVIQVVRGELRDLPRPFGARSGRMFDARIPDLAHLAENAPGQDGKLQVFVFEGPLQLKFPSAIHDHIARYGAGRYSHWGDYIFFSSSDNTDPNTNGRQYRLLIATP
jgi:2-polyprenyl-6-hydroxyphenyl methylase/3-demethylubiquinone-9 3-methyltransferase